MGLMDMRTVTITEKGQVAIPKDVRKLKGFGAGSKVAILSFGDHLELRPLAQVSEKLFTAMASEKALAKTWSRKEEDAAWKRI